MYLRHRQAGVGRWDARLTGRLPGCCFFLSVQGSASFWFVHNLFSFFQLLLTGAGPASSFPEPCRLCSDPLPGYTLAWPLLATRGPRLCCCSSRSLGTLQTIRDTSHGSIAPLPNPLSTTTIPAARARPLPSRANLSSEPPPFQA